MPEPNCMYIQQLYVQLILDCVAPFQYCLYHQCCLW
jgi:hypothetical protein